MTSSLEIEVKRLKDENELLKMTIARMQDIVRTASKLTDVAQHLSTHDRYFRGMTVGGMVEDAQHVLACFKLEDGNGKHH